MMKCKIFYVLSGNTVYAGDGGEMGAEVHGLLHASAADGTVLPHTRNSKCKDYKLN